MKYQNKIAVIIMIRYNSLYSKVLEDKTKKNCKSCGWESVKDQKRWECMKHYIYQQMVLNNGSVYHKATLQKIIPMIVPALTINITLTIFQEIINERKEKQVLNVKKFNKVKE